MPQPTVIGSWLTLIVPALESYGIDGPGFLARHGIDYEHASDPDQRIAIAAMAELWEDAVSCTGDSSFGLKAGTFVTANTLSAPGMALWSACTIKDHLQCLVRYIHLIANVNQLSLYDEGDCYVSSSSMIPDAAGRQIVSDQALDAFCAAMHTLRRVHFRKDFSPQRVELTRATPLKPQDYESLFGCPVTYENPRLQVYISKADAEAPVPGHSAQVAKAMEALADEYLVQLQVDDDLLVKLRQALVILLPQGCATLEQVADHLHTSKRTLHRKLESRQTSFREQVEGLRRELVYRYMSQPDMSLGDISFLLGFSTNSNFTRAFKRWAGKTPQEYRRDNLIR